MISVEIGMSQANVHDVHLKGLVTLDYFRLCTLLIQLNLDTVFTVFSMLIG